MVNTGPFPCHRGGPVLPVSVGFSTVPSQVDGNSLNEGLEGMLGSSMSDDVQDQTSPSDGEEVGRIQAIADYSRNKVRVASVDISARVREFDAKKAVDAVLDAPKRLKREWQKSGATGVITRFPIATVALFLMITFYFVTTSGFLDDTQFDDDPNEPALNVNGDMEVYLPDGSEVKELIGMVEEDWTTNVMVIYIESDKNNITDQRFSKRLVT